jgi:hypothetical protein
MCINIILVEHEEPHVCTEDLVDEGSAFHMHGVYVREQYTEAPWCASDLVHGSLTLGSLL